MALFLTRAVAQDLRSDIWQEACKKAAGGLQREADAGFNLAEELDAAIALEIEGAGVELTSEELVEAAQEWGLLG